MAAQTKTKSAGKLSLPPYPFRWEGLEDFSYQRDKNGLPLVYINKQFGLCYNPITISQYGLWHLQRYDSTSNEQNLEKARLCGRWLLDNAREWHGDMLAWVYNYDMDFYGPTAPWISSMAQGQAISLLLRLADAGIINDEVEITHNAVKVFFEIVRNGGVVSHFPDGSFVFEEFPTQPPSIVLNGHIFALLGIFDYANYWDDKPARELFEIACQGLVKNLDRYDAGYWNFYDLHPTKRLASPMYMRVHIQLLQILAELSKNTFFVQTSEKWQSYLTNPVCRIRWLWTKIFEKIRLKF